MHGNEQLLYEMKKIKMKLRQEKLIWKYENPIINIFLFFNKGELNIFYPKISLPKNTFIHPIKYTHTPSHVNLFLV